jgi:hypothetical protein
MSCLEIAMLNVAQDDSKIGKKRRYCARLRSLGLTGLSERIWGSKELGDKYPALGLKPLPDAERGIWVAFIRANTYSDLNCDCFAALGIPEEVLQLLRQVEDEALFSSHMMGINQACREGVVLGFRGDEDTPYLLGNKEVYLLARWCPKSRNLKSFHSIVEFIENDIRSNGAIAHSISRGLAASVLRACVDVQWS